MCTDAECLLKHRIIATVDVPDYSRPYTGTIHATKFRYKEELRIYNEYKEHMQHNVKALTPCFTEGLLIDLETNGEVIGYTAIEIYDHIKDNFLLLRDLSRESTKTKR